MDVDGGILVTAEPSSQLIQARQESSIRYGDLLVLQGKLDEAPCSRSSIIGSTWHARAFRA